jgi:hypothetical protein
MPGADYSYAAALFIRITHPGLRRKLLKMSLGLTGKFEGRGEGFKKISPVIPFRPWTGIRLAG